MRYREAIVCGYHVEWYDELLSTNRTAKESERVVGERLAVIADRQTEGRGRLGRSFCSPKGGLYMSVRFPVPENADMTALTVRAAVAVAQAIESICDIKIGIKWVNDLYVNGRKLCGILAELVSCGDVREAVLGVGVNLASASLSPEVDKIATSIERECGASPDRDRVAEEVLMRLAEIDLSTSQPRYIDEYRRRSVLLGKNVTVIPHTGQSYAAEVVGIGDDGALEVLAGGEPRRIFTGDVSVRLI